MIFSDCGHLCTLEPRIRIRFRTKCARPDHEITPLEAVVSRPGGQDRVHKTVIGTGASFKRLCIKANLESLEPAHDQALHKREFASCNADCL